MKSNYDLSKNIIRKTTENFHPRADDPLLLIICRKQSMKAITCVELYTENMPTPRIGL